MSICVFSIDPGIKKSGYSVVRLTSQSKIKILEAGVLFHKNLLEVFNEVKKILKEFKPHHIVLENVYSLKYNPKVSFEISQIIGIISLIGIMNNKKIFTYHPTKIKKSLTGYGRASKKQIYNFVRNYLKTKNKFQYDVADAVSLSIHHCKNLSGRKRS